MAQRFAAAVLFCWTIAWTGHAQPGGAAHVVLSADGVWRDGGRSLARGDRITVGASLSAASPGSVLLDCGERRWLSYTCKTGECRSIACALQGTNVQVDQVELPETGFVNAIGNLLSPVTDLLLKRQPREPRIAAARQGGNPADAVLLLGARGVHLGPSFGRVLADRYCVRLSPLPQGTSRSLSFDWDRDTDREGVAAAAGLVAGLYQLEKGPGAAPGACVPDADGTAAWVLIAPPAEFERASAVWSDQRRHAAALENAGASITVVAALRHAILAALAESSSAR